MARAYTSRLGGGPFSANDLVVVGRGEDGYTVVVRDVSIYNGGVGSTHVYVQVHAGANYIPLVSAELESAAVFHYEGRQVLEPGDELVCFSTLEPGSALVTGYRLSTN